MGGVGEQYKTELVRAPATPPQNTMGTLFPVHSGSGMSTRSVWGEMWGYTWND